MIARAASQDVKPQKMIWATSTVFVQYFQKDKEKTWEGKIKKKKKKKMNKNGDKKKKIEEKKKKYPGILFKLPEIRYILTCV